MKPLVLSPTYSYNKAYGLTMNEDIAAALHALTVPSAGRDSCADSPAKAVGAKKVRALGGRHQSLPTAPIFHAAAKDLRPLSRTWGGALKRAFIQDHGSLPVHAVRSEKPATFDARRPS